MNSVKVIPAPLVLGGRGADIIAIRTVKPLRSLTPAGSAAQ
jgi:hypothetical protein